MKILIVNENIIGGGAEQSCLKMKKLLEEHEQEVYYLTFDDRFYEKTENMINKNNIINIKVNKNIINKLIFKPILYLKIRNILRKISPDKVILNNIFCSPITQITALNGYEIYQIVRDYTIVCPKMTSVKMDYSICNGYNYEKCIKQCTYHDSKIQLILKLYLVKYMEKLRKKIVKQCIAPSKNLNKYLLKYGYKSCCINNPMDIFEDKYVKEKEWNENYKEYIYVGMINQNKGIFKFLDIYKIFSHERSVKLKIIGKCITKEDQEKLNQYLKENSKIEFRGYMSHDETIKEIRKSDFIVVPSLWIENYPTTALEGMLYGAVVLGSNRGGIPEIIGKNRGITFDILNYEDILSKLEKSYKMSRDDYIKLKKNAYEYIVNNNSFDTYYKKLMNILNDK